MKYNSHTHNRRSIRLKGYDYSQAGAYFITICCQDMKYRFGTIVGSTLAVDPNKTDPNAIDQIAVDPNKTDPNAIDQIANPQNTIAHMKLNEFGQIAYDEWAKLPKRFSNCAMDVFQIMPNHMHGIIILSPVRAPLAGAPYSEFIANSKNANSQNANSPIGIDFNRDQTGQPHGIAPAGAADSPAATIGDIIGAYKSIVANSCLAICKTKNEKLGKLWQRNYYEIIIRNEISYLNISNYILDNPSKWNADRFHKK